MLLYGVKILNINAIGNKMIKALAFSNCQCAATAIEYTLIATGIAMAIAVVVFAFGGDLATLFDSFISVIEN